ncbi:MAG: pantetheine-phosphate adenylyltransferase [Candidatus Limiplasma sp.]|nr:pantetheine-phosphate adenylyltransferase [Candidatus Limiplasma sp.]
MREGVCVYPGSFDPVTSGHLDLIERAAKVFPRVIVAVLNNPSKRGFFSVQERVRLLEKACRHLPKVEIDSFEGLLVDYMKKAGAGIVIRGLRAVTDFESEFLMAQVNHQISPEIETLFMMTSPQYAYISSSVVREIGGFGGEISSFVPASILEDVSTALGRAR